VSIAFEELDSRRTRIGELSLRRRILPSLGVEVFEIKLGDEFLMSSLFTAGEIALAELGLSGFAGASLDVAVGGLGLGYTARAALDQPGVASVLVIEAIQEVIEWHVSGLLPLGPGLTGDKRLHLAHGDFFALVNSPAEGFDVRAPGRRFDAILLDIDHSPSSVLHPSHAAFYAQDGLQNLAKHLKPGGIFALWSNEPPDSGFLDTLAGVFATSRAQVVTFHNPLQRREAANTIYIATKAAL
jgi:spermidine synthase